MPARSGFWAELVVTIHDPPIDCKRDTTPCHLSYAELCLLLLVRQHARACYALWSADIPDSRWDGHSRVRGNPGGPPDLDPGGGRDDLSSIHPCTWQSVQHA
jgi:hypothetical protein